MTIRGGFASARYSGATAPAAAKPTQTLQASGDGIEYLHADLFGNFA